MRLPCSNKDLVIMGFITVCALCFTVRIYMDKIKGNVPITNLFWGTSPTLSTLKKVQVTTGDHRDVEIADRTGVGQANTNNREQQVNGDIRETARDKLENIERKFNKDVKLTANATRSHAVINGSSVRQQSVDAVSIKNQQNISMTNQKNIQTEPAGTYIHSTRFDVIIKVVYAYFYLLIKQVPQSIDQTYTEYIRISSNRSKNCNDPSLTWEKPSNICESVRETFHACLNNTRDKFLDSNKSQVVVDIDGVLLSGGDRLAASIVLSKDVRVKHVNRKGSKHIFVWHYRWFVEKGYDSFMTDLVLLEWMKIQMNLKLSSQVSIVSIFSEDDRKTDRMHKIIENECSKDGHILYEKALNFTKLGMKELITHMYGQQTWIDGKIQPMITKFKSDFFRVQFIFILGKSVKELTECKMNIRTLYDAKPIKSSIHIPDSPEENLIVAQMILNNNSLQVMNYGSGARQCQSITSELAHRAHLPMVSTMPNIYIGNEDIMLDSGTVLALFGIRPGTDVDLLFLHEVDKRLLGKKNGMLVEKHSFKSNHIGQGRAWGEEHLSKDVTKWDLFYDPHNYGYCYGVKFVSLEQMIRYKLRRNEPNKDNIDVDKISLFLKGLSSR